MKIPPEVWGPFFWHTIHITALGYSNKPTYAQKKAAKEFYTSLTVLIPCPVCREHYAKHVETYPITPHLDSRDDLFKWTVVLHNAVNKDLRKPEFSENDSIAFYRRLGERGKSPVISHFDFEEVDTRSFARGLGTGIGGMALLAGVVYLVAPR
jgi:hypothetical protein